MAITAKKRKSLPASSFAYPKQRKYPLDTKARARGALSLSARKNTFGSYSHVAKRVRAKYGNTIASVGRKRGTTSRAGYRRRKR